MVTEPNTLTDHVGGAPKAIMVTDHVIRELTVQQQRIVAACVALPAPHVAKGKEDDRGGEP